MSVFRAAKMVCEQRCRWCAGQVCALPLVAAQLFDTSPVLLKSLIDFLLLSKSRRCPGNGQCRSLVLALPRTPASSVGCRALNAGGSVFIVCNPVFPVLLF